MDSSSFLPFCGTLDPCDTSSWIPSIWTGTRSRTGSMLTSSLPPGEGRLTTGPMARWLRASRISPLSTSPGRRRRPTAAGLGSGCPQRPSGSVPAAGGAESSDYPWGDHEPGKEDARFDTPDGPEEVCHFPPNAFDLCDMAGNVWEWTGDWYSREYYVRAPEKNPSGPSRGEYRVMRGGSWADAAKYLSCGHRSFARPAERSPNIGFRCVRSP